VVIALVKGIVRGIGHAILRGIPESLSPWILVNGYWLDPGVWKDGHSWLDGGVVPWILDTKYWQDVGVWADTSIWKG
jgi:hypothetical protein